MLLRLLSIVSPILLCSAIGFVWARSGRPYDIRFVTRLITDVGMPFLIISGLSRAEFDAGMFANAGLAAALMLVGFALLGLAALRLFGRSIRDFLPSLMFPNTGNMGLPLCLFAFGDHGLSLALIVFIVVSLTHFTLGVALVSGHTGARQFFGNPIVAAALMGMVLLFTGWSLPAWVARTVDMLAGLAIPLMLLTLGVSLARLQIRTFATSAVFALLRLGFGFGVGVAVASTLGLEGVSRGVVVLQASMPVAVFNYLLAERYDRSPETVAGNVVLSTLLSFITLPLVLWFVLAG